MKKDEKTHLAVYGNTLLKRSYCDCCQSMAFVIDDEFQCCGAYFQGQATYTKRISDTYFRRVHISKKVKTSIMLEQDYRCLYCCKAFGSVVERHGKELRLRIHYDHVIPFIYSQDSSIRNIVAACHVCNGIKSDKMYKDLDDASLYFRQRREEKGYNF